MIRKNWIAVALFALSAPLMAQQQQQQTGSAQAPTDPNTLSYALGFLYGSQLKDMDFEANMERVSTGMEDAINGTGPAVPEEQMQAALQQMQERMRQKQMEQFRKVAQQNKEAGEAFLAENANKKGIEVLASGLQYRVIEEGEGDTPTLDDTVVAHYRGSLPDGLEFDSSFARGQPATFQVKSVIKGWQEALTMMKEGAKWQIFVPPELAYGEQGKRPIGPNQTLVFDLHLLEIKEGGEG
jgi:FKBP-type peptidyl-prolyl cis-trans isomerase FklB